MMTMTKKEEPTFPDLPDCFASSWPTLDSEVSPSALCYRSKRSLPPSPSSSPCSAIRRWLSSPCSAASGADWRLSRTLSWSFASSDICWSCPAEWDYKKLILINIFTTSTTLSQPVCGLTSNLPLPRSFDCVVGVVQTSCTVEPETCRSHLLLLLVSKSHMLVDFNPTQPLL